jgi:hypothetical protein
MHLYDYYTYSEANGYGQPTLSSTVQGTIKIAVYNSSTAIQDNIKYKDCSYVGITHDKAVNDSYVIQYGNEKLKVQYVNPQGRYKQVFLKNI